MRKNLNTSLKGYKKIIKLKSVDNNAFKQLLKEIKI